MVICPKTTTSKPSFLTGFSTYTIPYACHERICRNYFIGFQRKVEYDSLSTNNGLLLNVNYTQLKSLKNTSRTFMVLANSKTKPATIC